MNYCIKREFFAENKENKPKIPRPPNAFMLYANENRKKMSQLYPTESNKDISKRLGNGWKSLDEEERKKFFEKARAIGLQHKKEFPDYVYNPKEARIRKAMRDATRERSIGTSPMLQRPNARRVSHSWISPHEELMMSPLGSMRAAMEAPVCGFPLSSNGNNQFMGPMNGYSKLEPPPPMPPPPSTSTVHTNYMQSNPLAQLQQHTEMWPDYHQQHQPMPPRTPANPFMLGEVPQYQPQTSEIPIMEKQPPANNSAPSITPPNCNENSPPDKINDVADFEQNKAALDGPQAQIEASQEHFMPVFEQNDVENASHQFEKLEEPKIKKTQPRQSGDVLHLPLSSHNFCASHKLFSNDLKYQTNYIMEYFQNLPSMTLMTITTPNGISFPYATYTPTNLIDSIRNEVQVFEHSAEPSFFHTDVGYVPLSSL